MEAPRLVALPLPRSSAALAALERVWECGDAVLPLDPNAPREETHRLLERLRPHVVGSSGAYEDATAVAAGTALVIATSGTTGVPKGVCLSHEAIEAAARLTNEAVGARPGDRWLCCLPLSHVAGLMTLMRSRASGAEAIVHDTFSVDAIAEVRDAAFVSLVPTQLRRLLDARVDLSRFERVLIGGARVHRDLMERATDAGARVTATYGMSETCGGVVYDGRPLAGVRVAIDDGRIVISSPTLMSGYRNDPALTDRVLRDGWFRTEDRGEMDAGGRLRVLGRLDDVIVTGGENVSASEVEEALLSHPAVAAARVHGEADPEWGEVVVAAVVPSGATPDPQDVAAHLGARLARHKIPRRIDVVDELPRPKLET